MSVHDHFLSINDHDASPLTLLAGTKLMRIMVAVSLCFETSPSAWLVCLVCELGRADDSDVLPRGTSATQLVTGIYEVYGLADVTTRIRPTRQAKIIEPSPKSCPVAHIAG
jgi:hypothetical protein